MQGAGSPRLAAAGLRVLHAPGCDSGRPGDATARHQAGLGTCLLESGLTVAHSEKISHVARVGLIATPLLMGIALVATVWSSHRGVSDASETLVRGQVDMMHRSFRARMTELGHAPDDAELQAFLDDYREEGLRYVATLDDTGTPTARAGEPIGPAGAGPTPPERFGESVPIGKRQRLTFWRPRNPDRGDRPSPPGAPERFRSPPFVLEVEPTVAAKLRRDSTRTLTIAAATAGGLLLVAFGLMRFFLRRELEQRRREQERRLVALGQMSAVLAHEIRNPLASLKGNAQLLARGLDAEDKAKAKADRVVTEAIRLESLTNDLLEFARSGTLERVAVDPAALLREAADAIAAERIAVDAGGAPAAWQLDRERIRQVLTNLLENAVQAGDGAVQARVTATAGALVYEVRDHGSGIPDGEIERIFEPFHTLRTRGTGLGLAVARRLVEMHGGTITAANADDGGARFTVTLPQV